MEWLSVQGVTATIGEQRACDQVSLSCAQGSRWVIAGETGSGKSTLLKMVAGLVQPEEGAVYLNGERVPGPAEKLVPGHPSIAYLSQHFELPKFLRVGEILDYAGKLAQPDADALFASCHIAHLLDRRSDQLSGGERQRVALAKLLVTSPGLLLLDEPFSNLDVYHKSLLKEVIERVRTGWDITCILVSHDPSDTLPWADAMLILKNGRVHATGSPEALYRAPQDEYTAALLGSYSVLPDDLRKLLRFDASVQFIRPDDLVIGDDSGRSVSATVQRVLYFGSHYDLLVKPDQSPVLLRIRSDKPFQEGHRVRVQRK